MKNISPARQAFARLHQSGTFVIPNPWDIGTAKYLRHLGFKALASTSAGFAFSRGFADGKITRDMALKHIAEIVAATDLPVNADFESGFAHDAKTVAQNVRMCVDTGVAGLSIEDATGDPAKPLYEMSHAVERIAAAREAIDKSGTGVLLTARAECFLVKHPDSLAESIRRLKAYSNAGADVLYAPGPTTREQIQAIVQAVAPKPVNILMHTNTGLKVADLAALGARRISVGSSLARSAWTGFINAANAIAVEGSFAGFEGNVPFAQLNEFFRKDR